MGLVKNYELSETFSCRLTRNSLMHAGRRLETLGSETKDFITHINSSHFYRMIVRGPGITGTCSELSFKREKAELRKHIFFFFIMGTKHGCLLLWRGNETSIFQGCLLFNHSCKDSSEQSRSVPLFERHAEMEKTHAQLSPHILSL